MANGIAFKEKQDQEWLLRFQANPAVVHISQDG